MIETMMKRRLMTAVFCALALLTNGAGALLAQTQQRVRQGAPPPPPPHDLMIERVPGAPGHGEFFEMHIAPGAPGDSVNFRFMSSEMHFDSKIVRGAPYSAEAVTESIQMLADGNRITRTSKASLYRDSEGRTRRDQTLNHIGPWATANEPEQTVFINDPVAGTHYVLNPSKRPATLRLARNSSYAAKAAQQGLPSSSLQTRRSPSTRARRGFQARPSKKFSRRIRQSLRPQGRKGLCPCRS